MEPLDDDLLLKVYPKIIGSVVTIDELIPPGATKSFRSSPLGFAEFSNSIYPSWLHFCAFVGS